jgi:hypothetical protein
LVFDEAGQLTNCTLTGNSISSYNGLTGGGAERSTLDNCTLTGNWAPAGGGASSSTLNNCLLSGNSARTGGGVGEGSFGSSTSNLNNCTLISNQASAEGGGIFGGTLTNCIVYYNTAPSGSNYSSATLDHCCAFPLLNGTGNLTTAPLFVNLAGGDLHLLPGSPCINAGLNAAAPGPVDLDGNPRIVDGTVDVGAYEWAPVSPTRPQFVGLQPPGPDGIILTLAGDTGRVLEIYASSNLIQWFWLASLTNTTGQVTYPDTGATNPPRRFYKTIQLP